MASKLGAAVSVVTDLSDTIELMQANIDKNVIHDIDGKCIACELDWCTDPSVWDRSHIQPPYDYILGAEISYDPSLGGALLSTIKALSNEDTVLLLAHNEPAFTGTELMDVLEFFKENLHCHLKFQVS